jgi:predicted enzyme related to lactoylglutathione lyase
MTTTIASVTIDCADPRSLVGFWREALGWRIDYDKDDGAVLSDPDGRSPMLYLQRVPEPKSGKNRAHLDLSTDDYKTELDRLIGLGASVVRESEGPGGQPSAVMADPQGNEFCLTGPS